MTSRIISVPPTHPHPLQQALRVTLWPQEAEAQGGEGTAWEDLPHEDVAERSFSPSPSVLRAWAFEASGTAAS